MFGAMKNHLAKNVSGAAAKRMVAEISGYHRIQASPDFRQAAEMVYETLLAWGLEAQLLSYPADEATSYWGTRMFQEWSGIAGTLRLVAPAGQERVLADYRDTRLALIPRSAPFQGEAEVVLPRNKGEEPEDYAGLDIAGKVVITNGQVMRVHQLAVEERGAVGIIFDGMRILEPVSPEWSLPDAIQYTSFWWWNTTPKAFGFALTPRQGQWLRRLVEAAPAAEPVRVHAHVVSRLYDGSIENVTATIPGETEDEVVLVAHLCHPTPCANDNASGAAAAMEVAHALYTLVTGGGLKQPRRTIRFLWVPEMTGSYAYLANAGTEARARMIAGLNLDMVGEDQEQCGSVMLIDSPPQACASFVVDLLERIREELFSTASSHAQRGHFPLFRYATVPFSGGSDHYIFSDPTVGIPMPMLIQWPDRFYHTTADTLDRVSEESLAQSAVLAGMYAYWLAAAGPREVDWLAREMLVRFKRRTITTLQNAITDRMADDQEARSVISSVPWHEQVSYWIERQRAAFESLRRLRTGFEPKPWSRAAARFAEGEWDGVRELLEQTQESAALLHDHALAPRVPRRLFPGPVSEQALARYQSPALVHQLHQLRQKHKDLTRILSVLALYWADGQRSVSEIIRCVELETGVRASEPIAEYFELLERLQVISW